LTAISPESDPRSHHHFKHPTKPGKVTVPHPRRDLHPKTVRSIYRQAAWQERR